MDLTDTRILPTPICWSINSPNLIHGQLFHLVRLESYKCSTYFVGSVRFRDCWTPFPSKTWPYLYNTDTIMAPNGASTLIAMILVQFVRNKYLSCCDNWISVQSLILKNISMLSQSLSSLYLIGGIIFAILRYDLFRGWVSEAVVASCSVSDVISEKLGFCFHQYYAVCN